MDITILDLIKNHPIIHWYEILDDPLMLEYLKNTRRVFKHVALAGGRLIVVAVEGRKRFNGGLADNIIFPANKSAGPELKLDNHYSYWRVYTPEYTEVDEDGVTTSENEKTEIIIGTNENDDAPLVCPYKLIDVKHKDGTSHQSILIE